MGVLCTGWSLSWCLTDNFIEMSLRALKDGREADKIAQLIPCKHQDLSLIPKTHIRKGEHGGVCL